MIWLWERLQILKGLTKLKNLSDVHSILLGAVENDFQLFIQKESYENASKKISTYWESWFSRIGQNVHLPDVNDRFEVDKIFHSFLYSIEINLYMYFGIKYEAEQ